MSPVVPLNEPIVFVNVVSGRLLDADTATIGNDGTKVQLYGRDAANLPQRQWIIASAGDDCYNIVNVESGRFLDADTSTINNDGTIVQLYGKAVPAPLNRDWKLSLAQPDRFFITNAQSGRLLDADTSTLNGDATRVQLYGTDGSLMPNRQWRIMRLADYEANKPAAHSFQDAPTSLDLLIVTPFVFSALFAAFQAAKQQKGLSSLLISLTATADGHGGVLSDFPGRDHPERIKMAVEYAYRIHKVRYVMLVGDASLLPARWRYILEPPASDPNHGAWAGWHDGSYRPAELYYASLYHHGPDGVVLPSNQQGVQIASSLNGQFDTWDYSNNNKYNEQEWVHDVLVFNPDYVDGYPDLAVARVPARTLNEVQTFLAKVTAYEKAAQSPQRNFGFIADGKYPGADSDNDQVKQALPAGVAGTISSALYNQQQGQPLLPGWTVAQAGTLGQFAQTCWWISYIGHGYNQGWDFDAAKYEPVSQLTNGPNFPIVFSASCDTGAFLGNPPFGQYQDIVGQFHWFWYDTSAPPAQQISERDPNSNILDYLPKPITVPTPSPYDLTPNTADRTLACAWLFNAQGGSIAYFGEVLVCEDDKGREFETDIFATFTNLNTSRLGDLWLTAQRKYWNDNKANETDTFRHPRIYLGIMTFFGDPSLLV
ncbi:MAG: RICIN domain-containing protein [Deltaproteobacteria bacterium]|nr:RICIN domain-containing protein [Deltaproteobacteria bacterium]